MLEKKSYIKYTTTLLTGLFIAALVFFAPSAVHAGTLTLGSATGVAGQEVTFTGASFDANAAYTFCLLFDGAVQTITAPSQLVTASGAFPVSGNASFIVPSSAFGTHQIRAFTFNGGTCESPSSTPTNFAVASFTTNTATVAVTSPTIPTTGVSIGSYITVTGSNFEGITANAVSIYFDDTATPIATTTPSKTGSWNVSFAIPDVANTGTHLIRATQSNATYATANTTVVVAAPSISLNPATAVSGQTVTVTGTNFKALSTVTLSYNATSFSPAITTTASGSGSFATTFVVPNLVSGTATIKALSDTTPSGLIYAIATLTISPPVLTLSPATAVAGQTISVTGTFFKSNALVTISQNGTVISTVTANEQGGFITTITTPDVTSGTVAIRAVSSTTPVDSVFDDATLTISAPSITISPSSVTGTTSYPSSTFIPGEKINVTGLNFKANTTIKISVNGSDVSTDPSTITSNGQGGFGATFQVPDLTVGTIAVRASVDGNNNIFATAISLISTPVITFNPTSGPPGGKIFISGTSFKKDATVTLYFNNSKIEGTDIKSNSFGGFSTEITVPTELSAGTYVVRAETGTNNFANSTYTIAAATVTLSTQSGTPGAKVTATGTNFRGNEDIILKWDDQVLTLKLSSTTTTGMGSFSGVFTVPDASRGAHYITATTTSGKVAATTTFTVNAPTVTANTTSIKSDSKVVLVGSGFSPHKPVVFKWNSKANAITEPFEVSTDGSGSFTATITVPKNATEDTHTLLVKTSDKVLTTLNFRINNGQVVLSESTQKLKKVAATNPESASQSTGAAWFQTEKALLFGKLILTLATLGATIFFGIRYIRELRRNEGKLSSAKPINVS